MRIDHYLLFTIDRLATCAIMLREITSLKHEIRDDAVEARVFVAIAWWKKHAVAYCSQRG